MKDLRTDLAKVKGLGSAKTGVHHWWQQRFSAVIICILSVWLLMFIKCTAGHNLSHFISIIQKPYNIVPLGVITIVALYHGMLGLQVIIEDYIHCLSMRIVIIILLKIVTWGTIISFVTALFYLMII